MSDLISRQAAIDALIAGGRNVDSRYLESERIIHESDAVEVISLLPSIQPETYKEKLNEIASALSEKFAYMNTCLNERDIILGYLGVKRRCEIHCNTDCTNTKCVSHPLSSAQPEPKRGKWVNGTCNQCGSHAPYWPMASTYYESNFCPNCGADMRGEKDE